MFVYDGTLGMSMDVANLVFFSLRRHVALNVIEF